MNEPRDTNERAVPPEDSGPPATGAGPSEQEGREVALSRRLQKELATVVKAVAASAEGISISGPDERFFFVNDAMALIYGYEPGELIGHTWRVLQPEERIADIEAVLARSLRDRSVGEITTELLGKRKDGTFVPVEVHATGLFDDNGAYEGHICNVRDLSRRKRADEELVKLRKAVEASGEAIFMTDRDGVLTYLNPEFTRLYGYTSEELVGKATPRVLKSGMLSQQAYEAFWCAILNGQVVRGELVNRASDGRLVYIDGSANPILGENGEILGFLAIQRDVTERKQLGEQLLQAQKMEAVGRLAGGVAHDFNNVLSVILGYGDLLLAAFDEREPLREDVEEIQKAARRAASLTRQLLLFSRREVAKPEVVDLNAIVANMEKLLRRAIGEDISLLCDPGQGVPLVKADPGQLEQVLMNLAVNSRDAMGHGGRLTIVTGEVELSAGTAEVGGLAPGTYATLTVSDTGPGMPKDVLERAFDPFFTTKPSGKGTGLGLSIVYGIVKQAGGDVRIRSAPGRGTDVRVLLPATSEQRVVAAPKREVPEQAANGATLLLVEDEDAVRTLTRRILTHHGYKVVDARNAGEAILIFEQHEERIDALVSDVVMPQLSGPKLAARLLATRPDLKVLFMSGHSEAVDVRDIQAMGASFLRKPFSRDELLNALTKLLEGER